MRINNDWSRRDFLKTASAATLSALAAPYSRTVLAEGPGGQATADSVIILWMGGGMAHTETFDPKRYTPFSPGLEPNRVLSTFPAIDTAVDNIKVSQGLEKIAAVMDRGTLIRSYTAGDLGFILHSRHQYQWHTGYAPPQTVAAPHIGAIISRVLGPLNPAVPAFIGYTETAVYNGKQAFFKAVKIRSMADYEQSFGKKFQPLYDIKPLDPKDPNRIDPGKQDNNKAQNTKDNRQ